MSHVSRRVYGASPGHGETGRVAADTLEIISLVQNLQPLERVNKGLSILDIERDIHPGSDDGVDPGQGVTRHVSLK